jgi:amidase
MEGIPTTAGSRVVASSATPALSDAACLRGARAAGARIVGRTNLHELALGVTGINPWYGTPVNPLDPLLVPGGSSSGSAVAVATDEADVAYGSDTGGSVRIPAACCGTTGLKTTWGRIPLEGVWPLAPTFDTVGPMARDVAGLVVGMQLLEPGFVVAPPGPVRVGRLRVEADPLIDAAIDEALAATEWSVVDVSVPSWDSVTMAAGMLLVLEAWNVDRRLVGQGLGADVEGRLLAGSRVGPEAAAGAEVAREAFRVELSGLWETVDFLATPTLTIFPPRVDDPDELLVARCTLPVNLAGVPALALPVPSRGPVPASLQLVGPAGCEERLLAAGQTAENAVLR